jgi:pimeloyl-ACP methyl ester carboxylesterase
MCEGRDDRQSLTERREQRMPTLVLLHGAWHGAWCWAAVQTELMSLGVEAVAIDLPAGEPDAGIERYADVVCQAIEGLDEVVVVAHSLAGLVAPVVADRVGARGVIMVAALWPDPGRSAREQARHTPGIYTPSYREAPVVHVEDGGTAMPTETALELLYEDCEPAVALAACGKLRPQHWQLWSEPSPLANWPAIPTAGLSCSRDRMLGAEGMHAGARRAAAPLTWLDSGHSPMLSAPRVLAQALQEWALDR